MRISCVFLLLLALWAETTHSKQRTKEHQDREKHDTVLVRTKRRWVLSTIELEEEDPGPFPRLATELFNDKELNHTLRFSISGQGVNEDPVGVFSINDRTGEVFIHKPIDRELHPFFLVKFDVHDRITDEILDKTLAFNMAIKDKNDNAPLFSPALLITQFPENIKEGQLPVSLQASDIDEQNTDNSRISMRLVSQEPTQPQISLQMVQNSRRINEVSQLVFSGCFDYDKVNKYTLLVEARDHGTPSLSSTATIIINISDSNTHAPVFNASTYNTQVLEMQINTEILRVSVLDKDNPNSPGSRAVYTIVKGNEQGNYKIETDPVTNEGVLTVIKGKDYEKTTVTELELAVENEEPLFRCVDGKPVRTGPEKEKPNTAKVLVKVIDVNDPPVFQKSVVKVYRKEEDKPGDVLYQPSVTDVDSDKTKIRFEIAEDPAKWMSIDPKTGTVTSVKKMDRESPFVKNSTYTVVIHAIDDADPPATGTGTLVVHLGDMNDNSPRLVNGSSVMCGNKADHVVVEPYDNDAAPFAGPFSFSLGSENGDLKDTWKIHPNTGPRTSLVSLRSLAYGNYSVPLHIEDQQGVAGHNVLNVVVCDCGEDDECRSLLPRSSRLHPMAILALLAALFVLALLLCLFFFCECREKKMFEVYLEDDKNQTLIHYNEEGGGSLIRAGSTIPTIISSFGMNERFTPGRGGVWANNGTLYEMNRALNRTNSTRKGTNRTFSRSFSLSEWNMESHLHHKLFKIGKEQADVSVYHPRQYADEGLGSTCASLDRLSFSTDGDDLGFLQDLGPQFCTLSGICRQAMEEKRVRL
ncbi:cadherin-like protein 26 [Electrophorus electricus]|uniref:cadherin-like protein 26 n=1 Tax=Electrophorus electricus TaxID=8005 RepID=UPI0015D0BA0C|nr:cadherin-like protein 26 [Electrophorus electricus]